MCEHKNVKYFSETGNVVCLDCGKVWNNNNPIYVPYIQPYYPTSPAWPIVTYTVSDTTSAGIK